MVLCFPYLLAHNRRLRLLIILSMKRIFRAATKIQESLREGLVGRPEFGLKVPMERSMMAVSYTHLDVYKRQDVGSAAGSLAVGQ